jgi:hypothetical protein
MDITLLVIYITAVLLWTVISYAIGYRRGYSAAAAVAETIAEDILRRRLG